MISSKTLNTICRTLPIDVSVDLDALDDTYLRLDCSNDPLETELEIKTPDFGAAALTLTGKRDNVNNATATITFRNQLDTAEALCWLFNLQNNRFCRWLL